MRTRDNSKPNLFDIQGDGERVTLILNDLSTIEEVEDGFEWEQYSLELQRVAITEDKIEEYLKIAKEQEYNKLAEKVREKRNKLLEESDKFMCLDRLSLDTSSAIKFLASLKTIFSNNYVKYRQALRDITEQDGFPYNVEFPEKPE